MKNIEERRKKKECNPGGRSNLQYQKWNEVLRHYHVLFALIILFFICVMEVITFNFNLFMCLSYITSYKNFQGRVLSCLHLYYWDNIDINGCLFSEWMI